MMKNKIHTLNPKKCNKPVRKLFFPSLLNLRPLWFQIMLQKRKIKREEAKILVFKYISNSYAQ